MTIPTESLPAESLPPKPVPPEPGECCGGGCARCVFDLYEEQLERWERTMADMLERRAPPASPGPGTD